MEMRQTPGKEVPEVVDENRGYRASQRCTKGQTAESILSANYVGTSEDAYELYINYILLRSEDACIL